MVVFLSMAVGKQSAEQRLGGKAYPSKAHLSDQLPPISPYLLTAHLVMNSRTDQFWFEVKVNAFLI